MLIQICRDKHFLLHFRKKTTIFSFHNKHCTTTLTDTIAHSLKNHLTRLAWKNKNNEKLSKILLTDTISVELKMDGWGNKTMKILHKTFMHFKYNFKFWVHFLWVLGNLDLKISWDTKPLHFSEFMANTRK